MTDLKNNTQNIACLAFSNTSLLNKRPAGNRSSPYGTSHLLLYLSILIDLQENKLSPEQTIIFPERVEREQKSLRSTNAHKGEERLLIDVLNQAVSLNAPDCLVALMEIYGGQKGARKKIDELGIKLNISRISRTSLTGRLVEKQKSNLFDYFKIASAYLNLARNSFAYIRNRIHVIGTEVYYPQSEADLKGDVLASIFWGTNQNDCMIFKEIDNELYCSLVINGTNYTHTSETAYLPFIEETCSPKEIVLSKPIINFLADTYFGEFQTEVRKRKKRTDALQKYGYGYSFQKIGEKLSANDYNIITYEGVLIQPEEECFNKRKIFYLGGDKQQTINELKKRHIHLANLGNNHAKDYGDEALLETIKAFNQNGIATVGAGRNLKEAVKPILLRHDNQKIAIFSGYWYRKGRDRYFDFYATNRSGVASLDGVLLEAIRAFKEENSEVFTIVLAHWGEDFRNLAQRQKNLAKRLVSAGADLIIGSGPHKIQPVEIIDGTLVFYSLGNGVFNSDGKELSKPGNLPYSYFLNWHLTDQLIRVYPFWNYNLANFWQPYFVEKATQNQVIEDIGKLDNSSLLEAPQFDEAGHLYYPVKINAASHEQENHQVNANWLKKNISGSFLDGYLPAGTFDYITISEEDLKTVSCEQALFVSLSTKDMKALYHDEKWFPAHRNKKLIEVGCPEKIGLILTDTPIEEYRGKVPQFIVSNTLAAASLLADCIVEAYQGQMITITGSVGKTSVRLLLEQLLAEESPLSNTKNSNLHFANLRLALALSRQPAKAIFEIAVGGMNRLAYGNEGYRYRSDVAILTSFGMAHSKYGINRNLSLKSEIFTSVKNGGTAIINGDIEEKYLWKFLRQARRQALTIKSYSLINEQADCYLVEKKVGKDHTEVILSLNRKIQRFSMAAFSDGQIQNVMASLLTLDTLGYDVNKYVHLLETKNNLPRNLEEVVVKYNGKQFTLIDDSHNSSILAVKNGIRAFKERQQFYSGSNLLVLGEVAELGDYSFDQHYQLKEELADCKATQIFLWGEAFKKIAEELPDAQWVADKNLLAEHVQPYLTDNSLVFVKGSASSKFYKVADEIKKLSF
ncbi:CapA family protein [Enterococcus sp. BWB1-3]|uniref:CapA family protein n=1 Tax=Enterococcus sp. BWB1-3 TaxID=2787713 RepID=UPI0019233F00|nr:CapA family protein [Enterococcus sp. BWB1-3]MBL1227774.1 CapA family protein [Enterococcus sp. BWB1-3]